MKNVSPLKAEDEKENEIVSENEVKMNERCDAVKRLRENVTKT